MNDLTADPAEKHNVVSQDQDKAAHLKPLIEIDHLGLGTAAEAGDLDLSATEERLRDLGYF